MLFMSSDDLKFNASIKEWCTGLKIKINTERPNEDNLVKK